MKPINKLKLNHTDDLNAERKALRKQVVLLEDEIKSNYKAIVADFSPAINALQKANQFKDKIMEKFQGIENKPGIQSGFALAKIALPIVPVIAGRILLKRNKKLLLLSIIGYGALKATQYIFSKNTSEHAESINHLFKINKVNQEKGIF